MNSVTINASGFAASLKDTLRLTTSSITDLSATFSTTNSYFSPLDPMTHSFLASFYCFSTNMTPVLEASLEPVPPISWKHFLQLCGATLVPKWLELWLWKWLSPESLPLIGRYSPQIPSAMLSFHSKYRNFCGKKLLYFLWDSSTEDTSPLQKP